jgi:hypothetical protein
MKKQAKSEEEIKFAKDTWNSLDEILGETNRTPESIKKRIEDDAANGSGAIDLNQYPIEARQQYSGLHVAIPPCIQEEIDNETFPVSNEKALYFEHLIKRHYSVSAPHDIVMDTNMKENGTLVEFNSNASKEFTGFTYYHE